MKIAGFVCLQLAALLFALRRIESKKRAAACLASFCALLEQLKGALGSEPAPMPELLDALGTCCDGDAAAFVNLLAASMDRLGERSFRELWTDALSAVPVTADRESGRALLELGTVLGRYELNTQLGAVESCRIVLSRRLDALCRELPQAKRLTLGLCLAASALLGIILI